MKHNNGIVIFDLDMYANRISFFSNNRERIGSWFGLFLTLTYIIALFVIFIIHSIDIIKRKDIKVYDSNVISDITPSIEINSRYLNLAFGLEEEKYNKYLDPSIYYPEIIYLDNIKNDKGEFETIVKKELNYSRCKIDSFGEKYTTIFGNVDFNQSYCLKDFNLTLTGGYKFERMSYILIKIIQCSNETSKIICKPQEIIDKYLTKGYFSLFLKDIGLNPENYNNPILPTVQNIYTPLDKGIFREVNLYLGITEIQTDTGLFYENLNKKKYLKFVDEKQYFYIRDEEEFDQAKQICSVYIRIDDNIHIQKKTYKKLPEVFSLIGGYMQMLSTAFSLISILTNLDLEVKILNNLFDFNIKQNKLSIKINIILFKLGIIFKKIKFQSNRNLIYNSKNNNNNNSITNKNLIGIDHGNNNRNIIPLINNKIKKFEENGENSQQIINNNISFEKSKKSPLFLNELNNKNNDLNNNKNNDSNKSSKPFKNDEIYFHPIRMITKSFKIDKNKEEKKDNESDKNIHLNLINYYCCGNLCKMRKHIALFDLGVSLYRKRMDIINVFTILLFSEKLMLKLEKQKAFSLNNDIIEFPQMLNKK